MDSPRSFTSPRDGLSSPVTTLMNVVLPAPFAPMSPRSSPSYSVRFTPFDAVTPPKCFVRFVVSRSGVRLDMSEGCASIFLFGIRGRQEGVAAAEHVDRDRNRDNNQRQQAQLDQDAAERFWIFRLQFRGLRGDD